MRHIETLTLAILTFHAVLAHAAVPCEAHRWDRSSGMSLDLLERSAEVFVGRIYGGLRRVESRQNGRSELGEITPFVVELVIKGHFRPGDKVEAFRILGDHERAHIPVADPKSSLRFAVFLTKEGEVNCWDAAIGVTTGRHERVPQEADGLASTIVSLILRPGDGYSEREFDIWSAASISITLQRPRKAFERALALLKSQVESSRMAACMTISYHFHVMRSCLDAYVDSATESPVEGVSIRVLKRSLVPQSLAMDRYLSELEAPGKLVSMNVEQRRGALEMMQILSQYGDEIGVRERAGFLASQLLELRRDQ
jgi:hypothetical protein